MTQVNKSILKMNLSTRGYLAVVAILTAMVQGAYASTIEKSVNDVIGGEQRKAGDAYKEIMKAPREALPALVSALDDSNPDKRKRSLRMLGRLGLPESKNAVFRAMKSDPDWMVRHEAIWTANEMGDVDIVAPLREAIGRDSHGMNRAMAIRVLSFRLKAKSLAIIKHGLEDSDPIVKLASARELGRYGDNSGREVVERFLDHADWRTKAMAFEALAFVGDAKDMPRLIRIAADPNENQQVQIKALQASLTIELKSMPNPGIRKYIDDALGSDSWAKRSWAATELLNRGDAQSLDTLRKAASSPGHPAQDDCAQALRQLQRGQGAR